MGSPRSRACSIGTLAQGWARVCRGEDVGPEEARLLSPPSVLLPGSAPPTQDSPTNKLLYAKEIPEYRKIVQRYYRQIHDMTPLSEQEMNAHLAEESRVRPAPPGPRREDGRGAGPDRQSRAEGAVYKQQVLTGPGLVQTMESPSRSNSRPVFLCRNTRMSSTPTWPWQRSTNTPRGIARR